MKFAAAFLEKKDLALKKYPDKAPPKWSHTF